MLNQYITDMEKPQLKNKSPNPKLGRTGTMLATPLTESEKANLRQKIAKGKSRRERTAKPIQ